MIRLRVENVSENLTGGCRCGAIRYECPDAVIFAGHCHCRDCQYASGGAYSTVVGVASESVTIEGETSAFTVDAASGNTVTRRFCASCGSPLFSELSANPGMLILKAGSLDDPGRVTPAMHIWTDSSPAWAETSGQIPEFSGQPDL